MVALYVTPTQSYISRGISTSTRAVYLPTSFSSRVQIHGISIRCKQFGTTSILKCYINPQLGCLKSNNKHSEDRTSVTERDKRSSFHSVCNTVSTPRPRSLSTRQNTRCKLRLSIYVNNITDLRFHYKYYI